MKSVRQPAAKRVLIVDDERAIADTLALILEQAGYQTSAAYSGESAIVVANTVTPSLIISDIQMPGIDGIASSLKIRKMLPNCRVVLFTGCPEAHAERAKKHGFNLLSKPLSPEVLLKHVHNELQDHLAKGKSVGKR